MSCMGDITYKYTSKRPLIKILTSEKVVLQTATRHEFIDEQPVIILGTKSD